MKELIETVVNQISGLSFFYAERYEFNRMAEDVDSFPVCVLLPLSAKKRTQQTGRLETRYFIQMFFADKVEFLSKSETNSLPVKNAIEALIDEFIKRLSQAQRWEKPFSEISFEMIPFQNEFDANLDGFYLEFELFEIKNVCV
jgi:hypothetical protein